MRKVFRWLFALIALSYVPRAEAGFTLGFGLGNTQGPIAYQIDPNTPAPPNTSPSQAQTTYGLNDWSFGAPISGSTVGGSAGNPLNVTQGDRLIIQIQLVDNSPYLFPNTPAGRLFQWGARLTYTPGVISAARDPNPTDGFAQNVAVNSGTISDPVLGLNENAVSQENLNYANSNVTSNSFGIANLCPNGWATDSGPNPHYYALANFVLTIDGPGNGALTLSDINSSASWTNNNGTSFDNTIFNNGGPLPPHQLFFHANPVPEPTSMALVTGCICGATIRRLRGTRRKADIASR